MLPKILFNRLNHIIKNKVIIITQYQTPIAIQISSLTFIQLFENNDRNIQMLFLLLRLLTARQTFHPAQCADADLIYDRERFLTDAYPLPFEDIRFADNNGYAGKGHFSVVRRAHLSDGRAVAVKEYKIFNRNALIRELKILDVLRDVPNTIKLIGITGNESAPTVVYSFHNSTKNGFDNITRSDFQWFLHSLLTTLAAIHRRGVLHRDVKLGNILADFSAREFTLIDFGCADFNRMSIKKNPKMGCIRLKSPELAIEYPYFDCATDVWAVGIACLDVVIGLSSFWESRDTDGMLQLIVNHFGSERWNRFANKYNKRYIVSSKHVGDIFEFAVPANQHLVEPLLLDLIDKLLEIDPCERITAEEALQHPYFGDFNEDI